MSLMILYTYRELTPTDNKFGWLSVNGFDSWVDTEQKKIL